MTVAGRWAQVLRNRLDDAHSCHGMPWEDREYQAQMSWKELFAADDVSTRKVERVFDVNLAEDGSAEVNVRAKLSYAEIIIRATCTQCFG